jgi:hypothetical protein
MFLITRFTITAVFVFISQSTGMDPEKKNNFIQQRIPLRRTSAPFVMAL